MSQIITLGGGGSGESVIGKAMFQLESNEEGATDGSRTTIELDNWNPVSTVTGVTTESNQLVLSGVGTFIISTRLYSRDNTTSGSNSDIGIDVIDGSDVLLESSRYYIGKPSSTYTRVSHEFTMMFVHDSSSDVTQLTFSTISAVGQIVLVGNTDAQFSTIEVLKIA